MKTRITIFSMAVALLCALSSAASASLLINGDFELTAASGTTTPNWTMVTNTPDGVNPAARFQMSGFANSTPAGSSGVWLRAFEGMQGGNPSEPLASAKIFQDVNVGAGQYLLSFTEKHELNFTASKAAVELEFFNGATSLGVYGSFNLFSTPSTNTNPEPFIARSMTATAPAGTTLARVSIDMQGGKDFNMPGAQSMLLDDFALSVVPEPAGMLTALSGLAMLLFRRR